jgi:hypothetical protein
MLRLSCTRPKAWVILRISSGTTEEFSQVEVVATMPVMLYWSEWRRRRMNDIASSGSLEMSDMMKTWDWLIVES